MSAREMILRLTFFLIPWIIFSLFQYYILKIQHSYAIMMYGGAVAIICISVRDILLEVIENRE